MQISPRTLEQSNLSVEQARENAERCLQQQRCHTAVEVFYDVAKTYVTNKKKPSLEFKTEILRNKPFHALSADEVRHYIQHTELR